MAETHGRPSEGMSCMSCWEDIDSDLYVEYKTSAASAWLPSGYCLTCIKHLLSTQWDAYVSSLAKTTCKAEQRRLLKTGPPINISDRTALPCPSEDSPEVYSLWSMATNEEFSAKLAGSLTGPEREAYWREQKAFYIEDEKEDAEIESKPI